jgi:hypothetical protein
MIKQRVDQDADSKLSTSRRALLACFVGPGTLCRDADYQPSHRRYRFDRNDFSRGEFMGTFLSMAGVVDGNTAELVAEFKAYAESRSGKCELSEMTLGDEGCMAILETSGHATVVFPENFLESEELAQSLSEKIAKPVFYFHIHDGDLWMYILYESGKVIDQFNPLPNYWEELDEDKQLAWQGNPAIVASKVPGLKGNDILKYLVFWDNGEFENDGQKAYPEDEFGYGTDWQVIDFANKLGFVFPLSGSDGPTGATYHFVCKRRKPRG